MTPPPRESDADVSECEICTDAPIARLVFNELNWPLCEGHLKASLGFIEPL